jgi:hypothetical protein
MPIHQPAKCLGLARCHAREQGRFVLDLFRSGPSGGSGLGFACQHAGASQVAPLELSSFTSVLPTAHSLRQLGLANLIILINIKGCELVSSSPPEFISCASAIALPAIPVGPLAGLVLILSID